ncbi:hypothetical protein ACHAXR_000814 [Thalassiosira sp. AJA248-18]
MSTQILLAVGTNMTQTTWII